MDDAAVQLELGLVIELVGRIRIKSSEIPNSLAATCAVYLGMVIVIKLFTELP